jgi:hypothetical protein
MANEEIREKLLARLHLLELKVLMKKVSNAIPKSQPKPQSEAVNAFIKKSNEVDSKLAKVKMDLSLIKLSNENRETTQEIRDILNSISY